MLDFIFNSNYNRTYVIKRDDEYFKFTTSRDKLMLQYDSTYRSSIVNCLNVPVESDITHTIRVYKCNLNGLYVVEIDNNYAILVSGRTIVSFHYYNWRKCKINNCNIDQKAFTTI